MCPHWDPKIINNEMEKKIDDFTDQRRMRIMFKLFYMEHRLIDVNGDL